MSKIPSIKDSAQARLIIYKLIKNKIDINLQNFLKEFSIDISELSRGDILELERAFQFIQNSTEQGLQKQFIKLTGYKIWLGIKNTGLLESFLKEHVLLIKSLEREQLDKLQIALNRGIRQGLLQKDIQKELETVSTLSKKRAKLIARNAPIQYSGALTKELQQSAGITHYEWQTSQDERVRNSHKAKNGKVFAWASPGPHPRSEINCRCDAVPVVD